MSDDSARQHAWDAAGREAAALVQDGDRVGLGTGRAAAAGIRALGQRVREGLTVTGVPTSRASEQLARDAGIPVGDLQGPLAVAFDGADIVSPTGAVVKGHGGAMVRERIVAAAASRFVVLVDMPKVGASLDQWGELPIAVLPFACEYVMLALDVMQLAPTRRDQPTDDGLVIVDVHPGGGHSWDVTDRRIRDIPGVVDTGLFHVHPGDVFIGAADGTVSTLGGTPLRGNR